MKLLGCVSVFFVFFGGGLAHSGVGEPHWCVKETEIGGEVCEGGHIHLVCIYLRRRPPEHG